MIILVFFFISALIIISNNNLPMSKQENLEKFYNFYLNWINQLYKNMQEITRNIVKLEWMPKS